MRDVKRSVGLMEASELEDKLARDAVGAQDGDDRYIMVTTSGSYGSRLEELS